MKITLQGYFYLEFMVRMNISKITLILFNTNVGGIILLTYETCLNHFESMSPTNQTHIHIKNYTQKKCNQSTLLQFTTTD